MRTRELITLAFLAAILLAVQVILAFLPNIELVSLLIIIYTLVLGKKVFPVIYTFVLLEGVFYGFGIWWLSYLYIWSILAGLALVFRRQRAAVFWGILSGAYGLSYGFLCAVPYYLTGGIGAGFGYWVAGIPFDIAHCIGNAAVCIVLFKPLHHILERLYAKMKGTVPEV